MFLYRNIATSYRLNNGIDPGLRTLDPNNATAFITDVAFEGAGNFTGTMTPITVSVPKPSTWTALLIGFAGLGFAAYRKGRVGRMADSVDR